MTTKFKIYPSSAAFMSGPLVSTTKNNSCHRYLWAQAHSGLSREELAQDIPAEYAALGSLDEYRFSVKLNKDKEKYEREVPFKIEYKGAVISGRQDFVLEDGTVIEKKSTTSANVYKRVFEQGEPEASHLAQLVSYLAFRKVPKGKLVISYYELSEDLSNYTVLAEKSFSVECLDSGVITVDGKNYKHTVRDLARFYASLELELSKSLTNDPLPAKPCQSGDKYQSPCNFCPLKKVCEAPELGTRVAFIENARLALLEKTKPRDFTIQVNTARRQANREKKNAKS